MTGSDDRVQADPLPLVGTALQVNLHPIDAAHAVEILPHQLRVWSGQVDRVLLTVDTGQTSSGRYNQPGFEEAKQRLIRLLDQVRVDFPHTLVDVVDFGEGGQRLVRDTFFSRLVGNYPVRAYDGGPFHVYFYGIARANARHVLHLDSDMMFGGGSQTWVAEATRALEQAPDALMVAPFGGPPLPLEHRHLPRHEGTFGGLTAEGEDDAPPHYRLESDFETWSYPTMSTRVFMLDMERFDQLVASLDMYHPPLLRRLRARLVDQDPTAMPGEILISSNMIRRGLRRLDFLGSDPGTYSLHPPYRSPSFFEALPDMVRRIEGGDIPAGQLGFSDINSSMHPWPEDIMHPGRLDRYRRATRQVVQANKYRFLTRDRSA